MKQEAAVVTERPAGRAASPVDRLTSLAGDADGLIGALTDAGTWPEDERRSALRAVDGLIAAASAVRAHLLLAERDAEGWRSTGAASFAGWRGAASSRAGAAGSGAGAAAREERQAEALVRLPQVGAAVRAGALGLDHASVIGAVAADRSALVRAAVASPRGQAELVDLARSQDVPAFARAVRRWADAQDGEALEDAHQAQRRARFLHLGTTGQGTRISGRLDAVAGHRLRLALEAVTTRPAADDDRTSEQRAADALVTLAEGALAEPATAPGAAVRPHVSLLVREETWRRHLRHRSGGRPARDGGAPTQEGVATGEAGDGAATSREVVSAARGSTSAVAERSSVVTGPATWEDGTPLPSSEVDRVLCDCELTRLVLDADDVPLNLGRTRRTYTGVQRRAVIARDRGCRWPGCAAQARWCEIHHVRWWDRDAGETAVGNGVLLCSFHHHEVHRRDLAVSRVAAPVRDARASGRSGRTSGTRTGRGASAGPGAGAGVAEVEARDPGGGMRYRFLTTDGRVVAGPHWVPEPVAGPGQGPPPTGLPPGGSTPPRVERTWHRSGGRPAVRHRQDAFEGISP